MVFWFYQKREFLGDSLVLSQKISSLPGYKYLCSYRSSLHNHKLIPLFSQIAAMVKKASIINNILLIASHGDKG